MKRVSTGIRKSRIILVAAFFLLFTGVGAGHDMDNVFTVGVLNDVSILSPAVDGFKRGMEELGYVEGKDLRYIYAGLLKNDQKTVDAEIKRLLSQKIDMFLTLGNNTTIRAMMAVKGTDMPVLASACNKPVESGIIEIMTRPGGNVTGVIVADSAPKALEWLAMIVPGLKKVYLPYNPDDGISIISLIGLEEAASQLGIEFIHHKVHSAEEAVKAIGELPDDVKAVFRIPSPTLDPRNSELSQAAIKHGIAMGARLPLDKDVLMTFATDIYDVGKKTARLAHQIRQGVKPEDLPVEIADVSLTINLRTAEKIGLKIPENVLIQAKTIIR